MKMNPYMRVLACIPEEEEDFPMFYQKNSLVSSDCLDCPHPGLFNKAAEAERGD